MENREPQHLRKRGTPLWIVDLQQHAQLIAPPPFQLPRCPTGGSSLQKLRRYPVGTKDPILKTGDPIASGSGTSHCCLESTEQGSCSSNARCDQPKGCSFRHRQDNQIPDWESDNAVTSTSDTIYTPKVDLDYVVTIGGPCIAYNAGKTATTSLDEVRNSTHRGDRRGSTSASGNGCVAPRVTYANDKVSSKSIYVRVHNSKSMEDESTNKSHLSFSKPDTSFQLNESDPPLGVHQEKMDVGDWHPDRELQISKSSKLLVGDKRKEELPHASDWLNNPESKSDMKLLPAMMNERKKCGSSRSPNVFCLSLEEWKQHANKHINGTKCSSIQPRVNITKPSGTAQKPLPEENASSYEAVVSFSDSNLPTWRWLSTPRLPFCRSIESNIPIHLELEGQDATNPDPVRISMLLILHNRTTIWPLINIWTDSHLRWNASDFGGIKVVRIPANHVWKPDIILYNNADPQYNTAIINTNVIVTAAGEVTWLSHGIFKSSCDINVEYFPFDIQSCHLKFASWTYDGNQVDLIKQYDVGDTTNYQVNGEFDLDEFTAVRNVQYYSCCPEPYPDITFILNLRRRPMFYVFNLILPCVLINGIALLVFYVPPESGEKVTLGISTLLSMTVFLMLIRESLPPTEKTPLIGMYYGVTICIVSFATGLSVVTLNVHHRGMRGTEVPATVRKLILGPLAKVLFVRFEAAVPDRGNKGPDKTPSSDMDHIEQYNFSPRFPHRKPSNPEGSGDDFERHFLRVLNKVYQTIERNEIRQAEQDRRDHIRLEWQQVSVVCDRFLLALFVVVTAVATFAILFSSPHGP